MTRTLFFLTVFCLSFTAHSQYKPYYSTAFGVRAGTTGAFSGLTVKGFVGEVAALEGIVGYWHGGISCTLLAERYFPAFRTRGLNWYAGGGGHFTAKTGYSRWYIIDRGYDYLNAGAGYGLDGVFGLEYKVPAAPIAFGIDVKPFVEFTGSGGFAMGIDPGIGVKLAF